MLNTGMPYLVPFISAGIGWLVANISVSLYASAAIKRREQIGLAIGNYAAQQFSFDNIERAAIQPENIEKILPFAEAHIDQFLRVKLPAAMPMLAMFISDKLVTEMKTIFMKELQELFPNIIQQYLANVKVNINLSHIISTKLNTISTHTIKTLLKRQLRIVNYACAITGFACGCFYIFLTPLA